MADNRDLEMLDFVRTHVSRAENMMSYFHPIWYEVLQNYLVRPAEEVNFQNHTGYPYTNKSHGSRKTVLKSPETKNAIETYLAKLMIALFGDRFIAAKKNGREDAKGARTVSRLLRYAFNREGQYRVVQTALLDMLLFGTGFTQAHWDLQMRPRVYRDIDIDAEGYENVISTRTMEPFIEDAQLTNIDIMDFLPMPGYDSLKKMPGCAKRIELTETQILKGVANGMYRKTAATRAILENRAKESSGTQDRRLIRPERPPVTDDSPHPAFNVVEGYEYYGEVPWRTEDGERWRIITVLGDYVVRDIPWPYDHYRVPFYDFTICPIQGRLYGLGPGEGSRYEQEFLDFLMVMIAESVLRVTHPPVIFNRNDEIDWANYRSWSPDQPILSDNPQDIQTLTYSPNFGASMGWFQNIKNSIQENTGALGAIQGHGFGINRASATEIAQTAQWAMDRPELHARYIEKECLPAIGRGLLGLYQQGLSEMADPTEELRKRVGELPEPVYLADISGDFDIEFTGTRNYQNVQNRMQSLDRLLMAAQIPQIGNLIDWNEITVQMLEGMGFDVMAQNIAAPSTVMQNLLISQLAGRGGLPGNGANPMQAPNDQLPEAQIEGEALPVEEVSE